VLHSADFKIFLQTAIIMKQTAGQRLKWELERERFRIEDRFPPPEKRAERRISDILAGILKKDASEAAFLPEAIAERWPMIVGEQLEKHTHPSHLKDGMLYVHADHPGWLAELRRIPKVKMLKKISTIPDIPGIKDIRFQLDPSIRTGRK
jgi:predicted nucleic acid-binding Zn ribbon protein